MRNKILIFLWASAFNISVQAATSSNFDQEFIKETLRQMLVDKPSKDFKRNTSDIMQTISIGFYSTKEIKYFPRVRQYEASDQLMGYMAYLLAKPDIRTLKALFYEPNQKEWNELGIKLTINPL